MNSPSQDSLSPRTVLNQVPLKYKEGTQFGYTGTKVIK